MKEMLEADSKLSHETKLIMGNVDVNWFAKNLKIIKHTWLRIVRGPLEW